MSPDQPAPVAGAAEPSLHLEVAAALDNPTHGERLTVEAAGIPWSALAWGDPSHRPLLLLHGVGSSARTWWRVGPALAASGRRVVAPDLPGHGLTGHWTGNPEFGDTATRVTAFARTAGLATDDLRVVGHSWGGRIAAALPAAGLRLTSIVLVDPPAIPRTTMAEVAASPDEQPYADYEAAFRDVRAANAAWSDGDIAAKAEALTQVDGVALRSVLLDSGDWDGGLVDLENPAAVGISVFLIRGDPTAGGLFPDDWLPRFEAVIGAGRIHTVRDGPHSPYRTHPVEVTAAILRGLDRAT